MSSVATEFGVGKSTLFDIKNSREKMIKFAGEAQDHSSLKNWCIVRRTDAHDRAFHHWFIQERQKGCFGNEKSKVAIPTINLYYNS